MKSYIDLHVHSNCSDGTLSPREVVFHAKSLGLSAIALTDHDTIKGIPEAAAAAKEAGLELIPGIEFSTSYNSGDTDEPVCDKDIHILGLNIDIENDNFVNQLSAFLDSRDDRNRRMIQALTDHGIAITWEQMQQRFSDAVWTRAHFARYLMEAGYVKTIEEAFQKYLGDHACCFVPRKRVTPLQAIQLIHKGSGYAILAHPLLYHLTQKQLVHMIRTLKHDGLDGIEALYSKNRGDDERTVRCLAKKFNLKITGGSDFHGENKPDIELGTGRHNLRIPYALWESLKSLDAD